ncbi:MAG: hypothetical protein IJB75_04390 [Oscillospiraceae bacterium]|nr:hypothetical protein [Oscillospiraceae bacterium]
MPYTVPNQRVVTIHREPAKSDFLGIKNENWMSAARDLGAYSTLLYLYLASNANGYSLALSPAAVRSAVGMARSTYHDQFEKLVDKGYLVQTGGNGFDFFEVPQPRHGNIQKPVSAVGLNFEECTSADIRIERPEQPVLPENTEINNREIPDNPRTNISGLETTEEIKVPEEKEIRIPVPKLDPKKEITPMPKKGDFVF